LIKTVEVAESRDRTGWIQSVWWWNCDGWDVGIKMVLILI